MRYLIFLLLISSVGLISCEEEKPSIPIRNQKLDRESSVNLNKQLLEETNEEIDDYLNHHNYAMITTGTGLRYLLFEDKEGEIAAKGNVVKLNFEIKNMDGNVYYSSKEKGPYVFQIAHSNVETGLHEAALLMSIGDKVKVILPHYLAHGMSGDMAKILPLETLIYDLEMLEIVRNDKK